MKPYYILGDGGLAREVAAYIGREWCKLVPEAEEDAAIAGDGELVIAIGWPAVRLKLAAKLQRMRVGADRLPSICFGANYGARLMRGVFVCPGCILTDNIDIAEFTFINMNCTIGHDVKIGRCCFIGPGANISGNVTVGDGVFIGTNAAILQGLTIGDGATVGAGAVVTKNVRPGVTVVGVPACEKL